uniref:Thioredoxin domain-containing protein n=1 Tax=Bursaphelenchus xylophilus TaxID=6326 RepID=A0A1I7RWS0_BURXY
MLEIRPCILHLLLATAIAAEIADFGTKPKGENPTLYDYEHDPIVQLDETTFNDTIYGSNQTERTAFMVEFYSDWCGHCRAYAPLYKSLANDVSRWRSVVRIGAINCADPLNEATCRANGVQFFPLIKYFPRNSSGDSDGQKLKTYQSVALMRDQLTQAIVAENDQHHFPDWPNFEPLKPIATYNEIFEGVPETIDKKILVFEENPQSLVANQLILDMQQYSDKIAIQKCRKGHPLTEALHISDYPTIAVYKRGEHEPIMQAE